MKLFIKTCLIGIAAFLLAHGASAAGGQCGDAADKYVAEEVAPLINQAVAADTDKKINDPIASHTKDSVAWWVSRVRGMANGYTGANYPGATAEQIKEVCAKYLSYLKPAVEGLKGALAK